MGRWVLMEAGAAIGEVGMQEAVGCAVDATGAARNHSSAAEAMGVKRVYAAGSDESLLGTAFHCTDWARQARAASVISEVGR